MRWQNFHTALAGHSVTFCQKFVAGENAGTACYKGRKASLDTDGGLESRNSGMSPEGSDAGTGMAATNSVAVHWKRIRRYFRICNDRTGKGIERRMCTPEIDLVTTPSEKAVAMAAASEMRKFNPCLKSLPTVEVLA